VGKKGEVGIEENCRDGQHIGSGVADCLGCCKSESKLDKWSAEVEKDESTLLSAQHVCSIRLAWAWLHAMATARPMQLLLPASWDIAACLQELIAVCATRE
jgi:hypothetical protein